MTINPTKDLIMKHFLLLFILSLLIGKDIQAQKINDFEVALGGNQGYFKDYQFSPLHYKETGALLSLEYSRRKVEGNSLFTAKLDAGLDFLNADIADYLTTNIWDLDIEVAYLRKVNVATKFDLFVGPQYHTKVNFIDFNGLGGFSWLFAHSMDLKARAEYQLPNNQSLSSSLSIPLVGFLNRPVHNTYDKELLEAFEERFLGFIFSGDLATVNKYVAFDWETKYRRPLTKKTDLSVTYALAYQRVTDDTEFTHLQNQLRVGIVF